ncbi:hypothetical protein K492DRAFT_145331 [Lichtheimia hyalospora FSU 10163]|nr:hypothetical protein K492DRAFT_145331 [Lichtheimia hyalospora FSU 10163]
MTSDSPITQVHDPEADHDQEEVIYQQQQADEDVYDQQPEDAIPAILKLDLRGTRIDLDRDTLVNLPESLLIAMFPNGLVLGRQEDEDQSRDSVGGGVVDEQVTFVDFDPACLDYVLRVYQHAAAISNELADQQQQQQNDHLSSSVYYPLLSNKQPIIVLREELEYYCIPTKSSNNTTSSSSTTNNTPAPQLSPENMASLKIASGRSLQRQNRIFDALQKNISRENNAAEQHLIDMLCDAGFSRDDPWGYRQLEPTRTCVTSMSLVLLKTTGPDNHMATAQKLLLFWRKPARKCWWDGTTADIEGYTVRLWARRMWTLELALV